MVFLFLSLLKGERQTKKKKPWELLTNVHFFLSRECYDESVIFVPKSPLRKLPF